MNSITIAPMAPVKMALSRPVPRLIPSFPSNLVLSHSFNFKLLLSYFTINMTLRFAALLTLMVCSGMMSCTRPGKGEGDDNRKQASGADIVVRKRDDGTISSVNEVDDLNRVHGIRVTYYADGKTVYSKTTCVHGIKNGPFIRYYRNGQVFEHSNNLDGKKHGPVRKYYMNGQLAAEFEVNHGIVLPGLKEYTRDGSRVESYPEIRFKEENHLDTHQRIDLIMYCAHQGRGVKYYLLESSEKPDDRIYLISENGSASLQYYVKQGESIDLDIGIIAEIPTELGNVYVRHLSYHLTAKN